MTKKEKFYKALRDVFIGAKIEGLAVSLIYKGH